MPGACGLVASADGNFALTSGSDATIRVHDIRDAGTPTAWWRSESAAEPDLADLSGTDMHEKAIGCLAIAPNSATMATGSDDGFVRLFSLKSTPGEEGRLRVDGELIQACARFGGPIRGLDFSPTGSFLAAAGDEPGVLKIIMTAQPSNVTILRAPSSGKANDAIVTVAFDPNGDFIATLGEKGQAAVWDVEKSKLVAEVDLNNRAANCVAWAPDGSKLVFGTGKGIIVVARDTWAFDHLLEDANDQDDDEDEIYTASSGKEVISALAWSSNGRYLLAAKEDSNISLWDAMAKKVLSCWKAPEVAQRMHWHPKANAMILIDKIGQWGIFPDVVPPHMPSPNSDAPTLDLPALPDVDDKPNMKGMMADLGDDEDGSGGVKRSKGAKLRRMKQEERRKRVQAAKEARKKKKQDSQELTDDDQNEIEDGFEFNASDVEADDEDGLRDRNGDDSSDSEGGSESDEELPGEFEGLENGGVKLPARRSRRGSKSKGNRHRIKAVRTVQEPFVPTSTPLLEKKNKKRHILAWNLVGAVLSFDEGSHDVIEIEFSDASKRTIGIKDHFGYTMGCLSDTGVLLASPKKAEHGSLITFRPFSSWSNNSDWTQFLHPTEDIAVVALGQRFAAVATTPSNVVRLFSLTGIQTGAFGIPGTIVSASASGDHLVIVYSEPDSASLKCEVLDVNTLGEVEKLRFSGNVMLCPDTRLEWVGFANDTKDLCSYDSNGWLWMLTDPKGGKRWIPLMQNAAKAAACDWFWVAAATSTSLIGAHCLSSERYPPAKPRPALRTLPLSAPVIEKVAKSGKPTVIERFMRTKLKLTRAVIAKAEVDEEFDSDDEEVEDAGELVAKMEVETDKCILSLMEDACRNEHNMRALDLASRLHTKVSFKYAIELAKHFKRTALAQRVEQVAIRKLEVMEDHERTHGHAVEESKASPVTPSRDHPAEDESASLAEDKPASPRRVLRQPPMIDFDSGSEAEHTGRDEKVGKKAVDFGIGDVTDDEDEPGERRVLATENDETREVERPRLADIVEERAAAKRKRKMAAMPASQASVKGGAKAPAKKKAKTTKTAKSKASSGAKPKFHNRFLKK